MRYWENKGDNSQLNLSELSKKVTVLFVLLHGVKISAIVTLSINLITMLNSMRIFYPSDVLSHDREGRPRDKFIYKKIENSKLCQMDATNEYPKRRVEYNVVPYVPHKGTIARWVRNTLTQAGVNIKIFSSHSCRSFASSKVENMGVDLNIIQKWVTGANNRHLERSILKG